MEIKDIKNWQYEELSDQEAEAVSGGQSSELLSLQVKVGTYKVGIHTDGCGGGHKPPDGGGPYAVIVG